MSSEEGKNVYKHIRRTLKVCFDANKFLPTKKIADRLLGSIKGSAWYERDYENSNEEKCDAAKEMLIDCFRSNTELAYEGMAEDIVARAVWGCSDWKTLTRCLEVLEACFSINKDAATQDIIDFIKNGLKNNLS